MRYSKATYYRPFNGVNINNETIIFKCIEKFKSIKISSLISMPT